MAGSATVGILRALLTLNVADFEDGVRKAGSSTKQLQRDLRAFGDQAKTVGAALTAAVTVPLAGVATAAAKAAIDFESSFAGVRKTVTATEPQFQALAQGFRDLAKQIPINVNDLNHLGEAAGQLGIKTENILGFATVMAELGVTTNLSADQAASSLARLANITGMPQTSFDRLGATIVDLGNNFATTESEIVDFALRIAGAGHQAGMSEAGILAIGTAFSSVGIEAEAGGTAFQKVVIEMIQATQQGGAKLQLFAKTIGVTADQFKTAFQQDATEVFTQFVEALGHQGQGAINTLDQLGLSDQRLVRSFLALAGAGDLTRQAVERATLAWEQNTALTNEAQRRFETTSSQLTILWNRVKDVGIALGNALLPTIRDAIKALDALVPMLERSAKWFADLPGPVRDVAIGLGALVVAAGPAVFVVGELAGAVGKLVPLLKALSGAEALGGVARLGSLLANPAVLAALAATGAGVATYYNLQKAIAAIDAAAARAKGPVKDLNGNLVYTLAQAQALATPSGGGAIHDMAKGLAQFGIALGTAAGAVKAQGTDPFADLANTISHAQQELDKLSTTQRGELVAALKSGAIQMEALQKATGLSAEALALFKQQLEDGKKAADAQSEALKKLKGEFADYSENTIRLNQQTEEKLHGLTDRVGKDIVTVAMSVQELERGTFEGGFGIPAFLDKLGQLSKPAEVTLAKTVTGAFQLAFKELPTDLIAAFEGGGGLGGALKGVATKITAGLFGGEGAEAGPLAGLTKSISAAVSGATGFLGKTVSGLLGSTIGGLLPGLGGLVTPLLGKLFSLGGPSKTELAGRDLVKTLEDAHGGWQRLVTDLIDAGMTAEQANAKVSALWAAEQQGPAAIQPQIDALNTFLADAAQHVQDVTTAIGGVTTAAQDFGGTIPQQFQPFIQQLLEAKDLTEDQRGALEALVGSAGPNYDQLTQMAAQYGITLQDLGPKFEQADLDTKAQAYYNAFKTLTDQGANAGGVLHGLSDEFSGLVQDALRFGGTVPEALQPLLQRLADSGQLVDENGRKLKDLSGISFSDTPLQTSEDRLVEAIQELTKLFQDLPGVVKSAAPEISKQLGGIHSPTVDIHYRYIGDNAPGGPGYAARGALVTAMGLTPLYLGTGGMTPRGSDVVPAMLTPGELVLPAGQSADVLHRAADPDWTTLQQELAGMRRDSAAYQATLGRELSRAVRDGILLAG